MVMLQSGSSYNDYTGEPDMLSGELQAQATGGQLYSNTTGGGVFGANSVYTNLTPINGGAQYQPYVVGPPGTTIGSSNPWANAGPTIDFGGGNVAPNPYYQGGISTGSGNAGIEDPSTGYSPGSGPPLQGGIGYGEPPTLYPQIGTGQTTVPITLNNVSTTVNPNTNPGLAAAALKPSTPSLINFNPITNPFGASSAPALPSLINGSGSPLSQGTNIGMVAPGQAQAMPGGPSAGSAPSLFPAAGMSPQSQGIGPQQQASGPNGPAPSPQGMSTPSGPIAGPGPTDMGGAISRAIGSQSPNVPNGGPGAGPSPQFQGGVSQGGLPGGGGGGAFGAPTMAAAAVGPTQGMSPAEALAENTGDGSGGDNGSLLPDQTAYASTPPFNPLGGETEKKELSVAEQQDQDEAEAKQAYNDLYNRAGKLGREGERIQRNLDDDLARIRGTADKPGEIDRRYMKPLEAAIQEQQDARRDYKQARARMRDIDTPEAADAAKNYAWSQLDPDQKMILGQAIARQRAMMQPQAQPKASVHAYVGNVLMHMGQGYEAGMTGRQPTYRPNPAYTQNMIAQRQALHDAQQAFHSGVTQFFTHEQNKYSAAKAALQEADQRYDRTLKAKQADLKDQMNFAFRTAKNNLDALGKEENAVGKQISATKGEVASTQGNERNRQGQERVDTGKFNAQTNRMNAANNNIKANAAKKQANTAASKEKRLQAEQPLVDKERGARTDYYEGKALPNLTPQAIRQALTKNGIKPENAEKLLKILSQAKPGTEE